jgi:phage shock protein A
MKIQDWYKEKAESSRKTWELAIDAGDQVLADKAMTEHLNYQELLNQATRNT